MIKKQELPEFEISMKFSLDYMFKEKVELWEVLQKRYNNFKNTPKSDNRIPKIIHQVWIGSDIPQQEKQWVLNVQQSLPSDWSYMLWGNNDIEKLKYLDMDLYQRLGKTRNGIAKQSDLIRYAVLFEYGGVYIDTDFILHKKFDSFLDLDSFLGIAFDKTPNVFNGLIGSKPKSKLIESLLILDRSIEGDVMDVTGPWFVTRRLFENLNNENVVAFPCTFFYPYPNFARCRSLGNNYKAYIQQESICTHLWSSSWM
jgi:inositol phosphorylceramide mannosyltransferase catalytic subunit